MHHEWKRMGKSEGEKRWQKSVQELTDWRALWPSDERSWGKISLCILGLKTLVKRAEDKWSLCISGLNKSWVEKEKSEGGKKMADICLGADRAMRSSDENRWTKIKSLHIRVKCIMSRKGWERVKGKKDGRNLFRNRQIGGLCGPLMKGAEQNWENPFSPRYSLLQFSSHLCTILHKWPVQNYCTLFQCYCTGQPKCCIYKENKFRPQISSATDTAHYFCHL
jgi:hypothetical protein